MPDSRGAIIHGNLGWLALGAAVAFGCEVPYEPELQFWPGDSAGTGAVGSGANGTGGFGVGGTGGDGFGGSAMNGTGGTSQPSGGSGVGANGGVAGTGNAAGAATNGGSAGAGQGGSGLGFAGGMTTGGSGGANPFGGAPNGGRATGGTSNAGMGNAGTGNAGTGSAGIGSAGTGSAGTGSAGTGSAGTGSSANCGLTVNVTTASAGGRYSPRNIGAIWVADQSGNFVRSLEVWAKQRASHLTLWNSVTSKAGAPGSRVDIVSEATMSTHVAHTASWDCEDFNHQTVPDGSYQVYFEMTDDNKTGPNLSVQFMKGSSAMTASPADSNNFKTIHLSFTP